MKLYSLFAMLLCLLCFSAQAEIDSATRTFNLKEIHESIFDLYFPEGAQLSTTEKKKRIEWREGLWGYIQTKPEVLTLLELLQPNSPLLPEDIKAIFSDIVLFGINGVSKDRLQQLQYSLRRHPNNDVRKFAATVRKLYSYLTYSSPLTSKIAGYNTQVLKVAETSCTVPPTTLHYANNTITHCDGEIDYLIIGSGPAGSLIAHELVVQKPGCRVVLIDSGSFVKPRSIITESSSEFMESQNLRTTISGGIALRNGQALGGGTIVNLDLAFSPLLPNIKKNIQSWVTNNFIDGSLIHRNSSDWKNLEEAYDYVAHHIGTRKVDPTEVNENNQILLAATPTATTYSLNARRPVHGQDKNLKISALETFIMPALENGLSIIPDVTVKKILFTITNNKPHASGIEIEFKKPLNKTYTITDPNNFNVSCGETATIHAKNIIVCAGTMGSAELLLRSHIPNTNIGKGIVIHPSMGIYGRFDKEIDVLHGLSASVYAPATHEDDGYFFESMSADPAFIALISAGSGKQIVDIVRDVKYLGGFGIMLIDSVHPDNKIFIDPITNQVQVNYSLPEKDKERFRKGLAHGLEMLFDQGAYETHIPSCEPLLANNEQYIPFVTKNQIKAGLNKLQFIENENFISSAHMQGSNKMGNSPQTSVVSHNFKVWDQLTNQEFENLYVCDSSIFPTSVGANPMQSIYTFAKLFIDRHIKQIETLK